MSYSLSSLPRPTHYRPRRVVLATVLVTSSGLSYLSRPTRSLTRHVLLALILAASYSLSSSPRLTRYRPRRILLAPILITSYSLSYSLRPTSYRPLCRRPHCHPPHSRCAHRVVLIGSCSSRRAHPVVFIAPGSSRRVVFANFPLFPPLRAMLCASKTTAMDVTLGACAGNVKGGSSIYRCTLDIENRTGLSHYAWNPLRVCECDARICCDVPCLDCQRNHGAITRVVRMPFALTWLRPEGKCPDTAASRRKMP